VIRTTSGHWIDLSTRRGSKAAAEANVRATQKPCKAFHVITMLIGYGHHDNLAPGHSALIGHGRDRAYSLGIDWQKEERELDSSVKSLKG
jgi:hypothetical protein